jgi:hypothetical protein
MMMLGERREHNNHPQQPSEAAAEENTMTPNEDEFPF